MFLFKTAWGGSLSPSKPLGLAASMASFLLAAGEKGKRIALPHSRTMIHQAMGGAQGQAEDIKAENWQKTAVKLMLFNLTFDFLAFESLELGVSFVRIWGFDTF